jgi:hypothetical protein
MSAAGRQRVEEAVVEGVAGRAFDPTIVPKPIGEIAKWEIRDEADGLRRRRWQPRPDDPLATTYPDLWTEPSEWPWDAPQSTAQAARTSAEERAA